MTESHTVVELLREAAENLAQYDRLDIRAHRVVTARALTVAPEGFFTRFDSAVEHGVATVKHSGATTQQDAMEAALQYVESLQTSQTSQHVVLSFMVYELFGFGILDPLIRDKGAHQISVSNGGAVSITVHGAERPVHSIQFRDRKHLSTIVNKFLKSAVHKKKVNDNLIRAQLKDGYILDVTQQDGALSLTLTKTKQKHATSATGQASGQAKSPRQRSTNASTGNSTQSKKRPTQRDTAPRQRNASPEEVEDSQWRTDPKTGKRYKVMAGLDPEFLKAAKKNGSKSMSIDELMSQTKDDPDFDGDDLNKSAETFMAHLRVPPNKEEREQLKRERVEKMRQLRKENPEEWGMKPE